MTQPDLARLEGLVAKAADKSVSTRGIMDRKNAAHELANHAAYLPALLARVRELEGELRICSNLLSATRPRDGYDLAWRCERAVTRARATLALNKENPDADR